MFYRRSEVLKLKQLEICNQWIPKKRQSYKIQKYESDEDVIFFCI